MDLTSCNTLLLIICCRPWHERSLSVERHDMLNNRTPVLTRPLLFERSICPTQLLAAPEVGRVNFVPS